MCDIPALYKSSYHQAALKHQCSICHCDIHPNSMYRRISGVWDKQFLTIKYCVECDTIHQLFSESNLYCIDMLNFGNTLSENNMVLSEDPDNAQGYSLSIFAKIKNQYLIKYHNKWVLYFGPVNM